MKSKFILLLPAMAILFTLNINAQQRHVLNNTKDALLLQIIKEKKSIQFSVDQTAKGPVVSYSMQPAKSSIKLPGIANNNAITAADNFHLTKDINAQTNANPANSDNLNDNPFAILNNIMYFSANDGMHGAELWRSDGTAAGTSLVKDIEPGITSSSPTEIIVAGGKLYFATKNTATFSSGLWVSDGTANGTIQIQSLVSSGPGVNGAYYLTNVSGTVYFLQGGSYSPQVWKTDGTTSGTVLVKDLNGLGQSPVLSAAANGIYFFTVFSNTNGRELWRSDGTDAGTYLVKDISDTLDYFYGPSQLTTFNNYLYFSADDGSGRKLWMTDGTTAATQKAAGNGNITLPYDYSYGFINVPFAILKNNLFFSGAAPVSGAELYSYNTSTGFHLVKNITPGSKGGVLYNITAAGKFVAFVYEDTVAQKNQLWATTGTADSTYLIKSYDNYGAFFSNLTYSNKLLYFVSNTEGFGNELWKTSGTPNSTGLIKDIYKGATSSYPQYLTAFNNKLYFNAASRSLGTELWASDGSNANTVLIKNINEVQTDFSGPNYFSGIALGGNAGSAINNTLFFSATKPETGFELYKSDGTRSGTDLAKDIYTGEGSSNPMSFTLKDNAVYFLAFANDSNNQFMQSIYKADNNDVVQLPTVPGAFINAYAVADNGLVYYIVVNNSTQAYELWRTDGTTNGNILLSNQVATTNYPFAIKVLHNTAFFVAATPDKGAELWSSDGTVASTKLVKDIAVGTASSNPYSLYAFNNAIFFGANDGNGDASWKSDGTASGTIKLKAVQPYNQLYHGINYNEFFCIVNGTLYFNATSANAGTELWKTNGTSAGTVLVKNIATGTDNSDPSYLTNVNGSLFFEALNQQLWKSDGTSTGTVLVHNLVGSFNERCVANNKFFFNTNQLLWVSDGTDAGTHQVADNGLNGVSLVSNLAVAGNNVFFNGYTDKYSYELYAGDATKVQTIAGKNIAKAEPSFSASVIENPVKSMLNLELKSDKNQAVKIIISDAQGMKVSANQFTIIKGNNRININASGWHPGLYVVNVSDATGNAVSINVLK